jgi:hypothetical protein
VRREKAARRRKKKATTVVCEMSDDEGAGWSLFFAIMLGVAIALFEAIDTDVLVGILTMPFMKTMKYLADKFNNVNLDPQVWMNPAPMPNPNPNANLDLHPE